MGVKLSNDGSSQRPCRACSTKVGTVQNRPKVVDSFFGYSSCIARGFLKTVNWNLNGAQKYNDLQIQLCYCLARQAQREGMSDGMGYKGETRGKHAGSDTHRLYCPHRFVSTSERDFGDTR